MKAKKINLYDHNRIELHKEVPLESPFAVNIEPTSFCNIRCNYCIHGLGKNQLDELGFKLGYMNESTFDLIIEQLKMFPKKIKSITFGGIGEPLLHDKLAEMISIIKENNITDKINLITNATLLTEDLSLKIINAGISNIKISLQGMSSLEYQKICGVKIDYDNLLKNITFLYKNKKDCLIGIKIPDISLNNQDEKLFYETYGNICDHINIEHIVPCFKEVNYEDIIEVGKYSSRYDIDKTNITVCPLLFYRLNIFHNGKVSLCTTLGLTSDNMNINNMSLLEIWNSNERKNMMVKNLKGDRTDMEACVGCNLIYDYSYSEDNVDDYSEIILERLNNKDWN